MMPWASLLSLAVPALLMACGIGLLAFNGLQLAAELGLGLRRRWRVGSFDWLRAADGPLPARNKRRFKLAWQLLLPGAGGLVLALVWHDLVLSTWSVVFGLAASALLFWTEPHVSAADRALEEVFLASFRSRYAVAPALSAALRGAGEDIKGISQSAALSQALDVSVQRLSAGEPLSTALEALAETSPLLKRLTRILELSDVANAAATQALLTALEEQAQRNRRLAERAQVAMTVVQMTLRALVAANAVVISAVAFVASWREYYLAHPLLYMVGSGMALAGYSYFRARIKQLAEQL